MSKVALAILFTSGVSLASCVFQEQWNRFVEDQWKQENPGKP